MRSLAVAALFLVMGCSVTGCATEVHRTARAAGVRAADVQAVDVRAVDEQAVRDLWSQFEQAFNAGDAVAATQLYALQSDRIGADGTKVAGRAAIREKYAAMLARRMADPSRQPFHADIDVRFVRPDVALLDGSWSGQRDGRPVRGFFTLVATKERGQWSIAAGRDRGVVNK